MKLGLNPGDLNLSKFTWLCFFGDKILENKLFALDKHHELKSASLRPIKEQ